MRTLPQTEAVILTGGLSKRMGRDKSTLIVGGERLGERTARLIDSLGVRVTFLGPEPVEGYPSVPDSIPNCGPLFALGNWSPTAEYVFVVSCDIPRFDQRLIGLLYDWIGTCDAAIPEVEGRLQPLCGLYRAFSFELAMRLAQAGERRIGMWIDRLQVCVVGASAFETAGIDLRTCLGANTPEELNKLTDYAGGSSPSTGE